MRTLKKIMSVIALMLTIAGSVWGKSDFEELKARYNLARGFAYRSIERYPPCSYSYDEKTANEFEKYNMKAYPKGMKKYIPFFHNETNALLLKNDIYSPKTNEVIIGSYKNSSYDRKSFTTDYEQQTLFWCFCAEELFEKWDKIFEKNKDPRICIIEYLGLNPVHYQNKGILNEGKIVFYRVNKQDLMRPAYEPNPSLPITEEQVKIIGNSRNENLHLRINQWAYSSSYDDALEKELEKKKFGREEIEKELKKTIIAPERKRLPMLMLGDYVRKSNPYSLCTRLGYTLNYRSVRQKYDDKGNPEIVSIYKDESEMDFDKFDATKNYEDVPVGEIKNYFGLAEFIVLDKTKMKFIDSIPIGNDYNALKTSQKKGKEIVEKKRQKLR